MPELYVQKGGHKMNEEKQLNNENSGARKNFWRIFWREVRNWATILMIGVMIFGTLKLIEQKSEIISLQQSITAQSFQIDTLVKQTIGEKQGILTPIKTDNKKIDLKNFEAIDITALLDERMQKIDTLSSDSTDKIVLGFSFDLSDAQEAYSWLIGSDSWQVSKNDLLTAFILYGDISPFVAENKSVTIQFRSGLSTKCDVSYNKYIPADKSYLVYYREKDERGTLQFKWRIIWGTNDGLG